VEMELDCRGLACPHPVLKVKEVVERGNVTRMKIWVDNAAAKENVSRFLTGMGYDVETSQRERDFEVCGAVSERRAPCELPSPSVAEEPQRRIAVLIGTDRMGTGDPMLGEKLLFNFIGTLKEMCPELWRVILINGGVRLSVEGSQSLKGLKELEDSGVTILVCGTCLEHFGLLDRKRVGETTNMLDIVTALQVADKVISLT